jgi:hypothetical protein
MSVDIIEGLDFCPQLRRLLSRNMTIATTHADSGAVIVVNGCLILPIRDIHLVAAEAELRGTGVCGKTIEGHQQHTTGRDTEQYAGFNEYPEKPLLMAAQQRRWLRR